LLPLRSARTGPGGRRKESWRGVAWLAEERDFRWRCENHPIAILPTPTSLNQRKDIPWFPAAGHVSSASVNRTKLLADGHQGGNIRCKVGRVATPLSHLWMIHSPVRPVGGFLRAPGPEFKWRARALSVFGFEEPFRGYGIPQANADGIGGTIVVGRPWNGLGD